MSDQLSINWNKYKYTSIYDSDKTADSIGSLVDQQMSSLDPTTIQNFNSLAKKFPNQSKDYLLSAAKIGLNADTQGIDKLSANDGIAQLKQDLTNYDNITNRAKNDKGFR